MANLIVVILMFSSLMVSIPYSSTRAFQGPNENLEWFRSLCSGKQKVAKLHFYVQDVVAGENKTVYEVARSSITSSSRTTFGQVLVVDDLLTVRPEKDSEKVGRVQGLVTFSDLEIPALTMNLNFFFTSGQYNGSTLSILGRNQVLSAERELPVVGGTGVFRMARGFAITNTYSSDPNTLNGVLEYTIYVSYLG